MPYALKLAGGPVAGVLLLAAGAFTSFLSTWAICLGAVRTGAKTYGDLLACCIESVHPRSGHGGRARDPFLRNDGATAELGGGEWMGYHDVAWSRRMDHQSFPRTVPQRHQTLTLGEVSFQEGVSESKCR